MSSRGAISQAIQYLRSSLEAVLGPYKWALLTADNPFQKWNILAAPLNTGFCIVSWKSDSPVSQSQRSLVVKAKLAITICARASLSDSATHKLPGSSDGGDPRLFEIHDRVKGAMLAITMPSEVVPEPGAEIPIYGGSAPLTTPDGMPLDAIEQTWEVELVESFSPEYTE